MQIIELVFQVRVRQHFMDGILHVPRPLVQPRTDRFLDLNRGQAQDDRSENYANDHFDHCASIHGILLVVNKIGIEFEQERLERRRSQCFCR